MPNRLVLNENELAERWGISPKTLQRWRTERRGPAYLKLSKRVCYLVEDILAYERQQKQLVRSENGIADNAPVLTGTSDLISGPEASAIMKLPIGYFTNSAMRKNLGIPHYYVGRLVRFKLDDVRQWEMAVARKAFDIKEEAPLTPPEPQQKFTLREAFERLARNGSIQ